MKKTGLRQKYFAIYFYETGNMYQSAIRAGYSPNTAVNAGGKILESKGVQEYLKLVGLSLDPLENTLGWYIKKLMDIVDGKEKKYTARTELSALSQIARLLELRDGRGRPSKLLQ